MSAPDFAARGMAGLALQPLVVTTFTSLANARLGPAMRQVRTAGHSIIGEGAGLYVADARATEALLSAHPRFCIRTAGGEIVRLVGEDGQISVEQGGALGDPTKSFAVNDQPAIQAAFDYAAAVGIGRVVFGRRHYTVWCPLRTSAADNQYARDGHALVVTQTVSLASACGDTYLYFRAFDGTSAETTFQRVPRVAGGAGEFVWRGGGLFVLGDIPGTEGSERKIAKLTIERLHFMGGRLRTSAQGQQIQTYSHPTPSDGWDYSDKGIWLQDVEVGELELRGVEISGFKGELFYAGGGAGPRLAIHDCHFHTTNANAFNPQYVSPFSEFSGCRFGNAFQAIESIGGPGQRWSDCLVYDSNQAILTGGPTPYFDGRYHFTFARRDASLPAPWVDLHDIHFRNVPQVSLGSWMRGHVRLTDSSIGLNCFADGGVRDVDLTIDAYCDQVHHLTVCSIYAPINRTTQTVNAPAGTYDRPPQNVRIHVRKAVRTDAAIAANRRWLAVFQLGGLFEDTVTLSAGEVEALHYADRNGSPGGMPRIIHAQDYAILPGVQPEAGAWSAPAAGQALTIAPDRPSHTVYPGGAGVNRISISSPLAYVHGQRLRIIHGGGGTNDRVVALLPGSTGLILDEPVFLYNSNDRCELEYDAAYGKWRRVAVTAGKPVVITGSATLNIPALSANSTQRVSFTVTGAAVGDIVNGISLSAQPNGVVATGRVSASNTVELSFQNTSGTSTALTSTTVRTRIIAAPPARRYRGRTSARSQAFDPFGEMAGIAATGCGMGRNGYPAMQFFITVEREHRGGDRAGIARINDETVLAVVKHQVDRTGIGAADHRDAQRHRFYHHEAELFLNARQDKGQRAAKCIADLLGLHEACKVHRVNDGKVACLLAKFILQRTVAQDAQAAGPSP